MVDDCSLYATCDPSNEVYLGEYAVIKNSLSRHPILDFLPAHCLLAHFIHANVGGRVDHSDGHFQHINSTFCNHVTELSVLQYGTHYLSTSVKYRVGTTSSSFQRRLSHFYYRVAILRHTGTEVSETIDNC